MTTDKAASVILDIESLVHSQDKCSSPKLTVSFVSCYMIYCNKIFTISFSELKLPLLFSMGLFFFRKLSLGRVLAAMIERAPKRMKRRMHLRNLQ